MRLRFWRRNPRDRRYHVKIKGKPSLEQLEGAMSELQNMSINNLNRMVSDFHSEVIGLRVQVRDLGITVEKLKVKIEKLENKGKTK